MEENVSLALDERNRDASNYLDQPPYDPAAHSQTPVGLFSAESTLESEESAQLQEPVTDKVIPPRFSLSFSVPHRKVEVSPQLSLPLRAVRPTTTPTTSQFKKPWLLPLGPDLKVDPYDPFDIGDTSYQEEDDGFDKMPTIPMMVLTGIAQKQGQEAPVMKTEISGAASGAAISGIGTLAGNVLKYATTLLIQRGFGPAGFGVFTIANSIITLLLSFFNLGLDDAMVRYVAVYRKKQQRGLLDGLTIFCSVLAGLGGLLGAVVVMAYAPTLANLLKGPRSTASTSDIANLLVVMAPVIPLTCMQGMWSAGLQGFKAFKWRVISQRLIVPSVMVLALVVVLVFYHTLMGVVIANFISSLVSGVLCLYFYYRMVETVKMARARQYEMREWLGFALPNLLTSIMETVLDSVDTLLQVFFRLTDTAIGLYAAGYKIANFISIPLLFLNVMFAPTIAELHGIGETQKLSVMFKIVTKWAIILSLPIFLIAVIFSQSLLRISGDNFIAASDLLIALSLGNMINAGTGSVGYMLTMTGHQRLAFINSLLAFFINLVLGVILTPMKGPFGGAMGTAIATGAALGAVNIFRLIQVWILIKIHPYQWDTLKPIGAGLISGALTWVMVYFVDGFHIFIFIFKFRLPIDLGLVPVFLVLYTVCIILFKFNDEDKIVLDTLGKKMRGKNKKKKKAS
jgi:O-antigen/teichoic acid export membrane protein